ncbi:hypothetical protein RB7950 [Rhodopirellula baltica SH 1]|uniref:Uncharacterized protein n=1 Tax=Rhodopirellula baltica (strain DSM 10527 / NCIMB 13988 / SH1) TaxID=243090 RepID=Q7UMV8_RHOBA|nr:hypothetical protein RB7950 [Rhodopirellula baltica SH 1]
MASMFHTSMRSIRDRPLQPAPPVSNVCETDISMENPITADHSIGNDRPFT